MGKMIEFRMGGDMELKAVSILCWQLFTISCFQTEDDKLIIAFLVGINLQKLMLYENIV